MFLIVGLGNPGQEYSNTWHNLGFAAIENFQEKNNFPEFNLAKKFQAQTSEGIIGSEKIILVWPQTFMNNSGTSVKFFSKLYPLNADNLIVVHDDIDLPLGKIKISQDSGSGGHKGVESIINHLGTKKFVRIRIGIQPETGKPEKAEDFVLRKISQKDQEILKTVLEKSSSAIEKILNKGLEPAMNEFNT